MKNKLPWDTSYMLEICFVIGIVAWIVMIWALYNL